jgi:single-stranded DNA-binding protein
MNTITITATLYKDAEVREFSKKDGEPSKCVRLVLQSYRSMYPQPNDSREFFAAECYGKLAEDAAELKKGDTIYVSGHMESKKVEKDDASITYWKVIARDIEVL